MKRPSPSLDPSHLVRDPSFPRLKEYVIAQTGLAYYADKEEDLARRLATRMAEHALEDCAAYLSLLHDPAAGPGELDELIKDLTIGETFFFRHTELFDALRTVVFPELIERNSLHRRLRVWSAGCATGAEPYSLTILLRRELAPLFKGGIESWDINIVGTDINRAFLSQAQEARFGDWTLRGTSEELRQACFTHTEGGWLLHPSYKEGVSFQYHNLVTHPFPSLLNNLFAFDLILCRNVMIYFTADIMRHIVSGFRQSLVEGGWLLVGHAEPNVLLFQGFQAVNTPGAVFYKKAADPIDYPAGDLSFPVQFSLPAPWLPPPLPPPALPTPAPRRSPEPRREGSRPTPPPAAPPPVPARAPADTASDLASVRALADRGEGEQALAGCVKLLERDKLNPLVHFYHGLLLEQVGQHAEAEGALRRAIYLDRRFVLAHYYLGLLLQKRSDTARAGRSFQNVLDLVAQLDPDHVFSHGDGISASELARVARIHLELLEGK